MGCGWELARVRSGRTTLERYRRSFGAEPPDSSEPKDGLGPAPGRQSPTSVAIILTLLVVLLLDFLLVLAFLSSFLLSSFYILAFFVLSLTPILLLSFAALRADSQRPGEAVETLGLGRRPRRPSARGCAVGPEQGPGTRGTIVG